MYISDWIMSGIAIFFIAIAVLVGVASAIVTVIYYYKRRCRQISTMADTPGSSMESANAQRIERYVHAEESVRNPLGWSALPITALRPIRTISSPENLVQLWAREKRFSSPMTTPWLSLRSHDGWNNSLPGNPFARRRTRTDGSYESQTRLDHPRHKHALGQRFGGLRDDGLRSAVCRDSSYYYSISRRTTRERCRRLGAWHVEKSSKSWAQIKSLVETLIGKGGGKVDPTETMPQSADVLPRDNPRRTG